MRRVYVKCDKCGSFNHDSIHCKAKVARRSKRLNKTVEENESISRSTRSHTKRMRLDKTPPPPEPPKLTPSSSPNQMPKRKYKSRTSKMNVPASSLSKKKIISDQRIASKVANHNTPNNDLEVSSIDETSEVFNNISKKHAQNILSNNTITHIHRELNGIINTSNTAEPISTPLSSPKLSPDLSPISRHLNYNNHVRLMDDMSDLSDSKMSSHVTNKPNNIIDSITPEESKNINKVNDEGFNINDEKVSNLTNNDNDSNIMHSIFRNVDDFKEPRHKLYNILNVVKDMQWRNVTRVGSGLRNLGNTCYVNSVLQALIYTPPFFNYLIYELSKSHQCQPGQFCLLCELRQIIVETRKGKGSVAPNTVVKSLIAISKSFRTGRQEDAHELLCCLMEYLQQNWLGKNNKLKDESIKETSLIHCIFGGYFRSQKECVECGSVSNKYDAFLDIALELNRNCGSIQQAFKHYCQTEVLNGDNKVRCDGCENKVDVKKSLSVFRPPLVLTIILKRFQYGIISQKINSQIKFEETLNLQQHVSNNEEPCIYNLYAIVVHHGDTLQSGHYVAFVKSSNDLWYEMNDSNVNQVGIEHVLNQEAYMLFYTRDTTKFKIPHQIATQMSGIKIDKNNMLLNHDEMSTSEEEQEHEAISVRSINQCISDNTTAIEQRYQKKTQSEHILLRPNTYVGSIVKETQLMFVFDEKSQSIIQKYVTFVPGLYKIFDEILVNAADNRQRDRSMNELRVNIDVEEGSISVYNNGEGIPIKKHETEGVYVPELIFGHLLTSSNYDDSQKKTTGGRNGYGAKLTNIFSTRFEIETSHSKSEKKYKQVWYNNMKKMDAPKLSKSKKDYTRVKFIPDFKRFKMLGLDEDIISIIKKRVYDIAGTAPPGLTVYINDVPLNIKSFSDYVSLYTKHFTNKIIFDQPHGRWEIGCCASDGHFQQVSFVNNVVTINGGTHVKYVTDQIVHGLHEQLKKDDSLGMLIKPQNIKNNICVFVNSFIENPEFDSQTKKTLTTRASDFGSKCEIFSVML